MTASHTPAAAGSVTAPSAGVDAPGGVVWALRDSWNEATRHLRAIPRSPELLMFTVLQPLMFVLLFNYVFGGAINVPNMSYSQYLIPGVLAQTVVFGSSFTGVGIAEDMSKGFIDRLRSLPISQSAVLVGRTISDFARNALGAFIIIGIGFPLGFRFAGGIVDGIVATALVLAFAYAFSWIQALVGLSVSSVEAANSAGFIWMFPLTFVSSAFVPVQSMPTFLQKVADANPFSQVTDASRALYAGTDPGNSVWISALWAVGITVVFSVLATRKFAKASV